jgi:hypothetical protein
MNCVHDFPSSALQACSMVEKEKPTQPLGWRAIGRGAKEKLGAGSIQCVTGIEPKIAVGEGSAR